MASEQRPLYPTFLLERSERALIALMNAEPGTETAVFDYIPDPRHRIGGHETLHAARFLIGSIKRTGPKGLDCEITGITRDELTGESYGTDISFRLPRHNRLLDFMHRVLRKGEYTTVVTISPTLPRQPVLTSRSNLASVRRSS